MLVTINGYTYDASKVKIVDGGVLVNVCSNVTTRYYHMRDIDSVTFANA